MSDYFDRIERQIAIRVEAGLPRRSRWRPRLGLLAPALSLAVVVAIVVVSVGVRGSRSPSSSGAGGGVELVFRAEPQPTAQGRVVSSAALARTIAVMRQRAAALGVSGASFRTSGSNEIVAVLPGTRDLARVVRAVGTTAQLVFYDWEANAIAPNGKTVASQLQGRNRTALRISEGSATAAAGSAGGGAMSLYDAVRLASSQPAQASPDNSRVGPLYYLFGAPGSTACAASARDQGEAPAPGVHCLLSGPDDNRQDLLAGLPNGVNASQGQQLVVRPGTVLLLAAGPTATTQTNPNDPNARFYVLKDHVALFGNEITKPRQTSDQAGNPDVTFSFTSKGENAFQQLTSRIAHRGNLVSSAGQMLNQHFAVALDTTLLTVPQIDFKSYPDGIRGAGGDIAGGLTAQSARDLVTELRLGALPLNLRLIAETPLPVHR